MEGKIRLAVFGQKRLSREGGIEIVVKELCTRMAQNGCDITCYNRAGHHVSGAEYDKTIEYDGIRQKVVPTIEKKGLAAVSSSFFAALCSAFGRYDADKEICIRVGMGESQTIKTMIHEVAHAMLHNSDFMKQHGEEKDRLTKETEAESIAFTVCSALGIDTSDYSFPYVASWASGKEMKELKDSMDLS